MTEPVPTVGGTDTCAPEDESDNMWPGSLPLTTQPTLAKHSHSLRAAYLMLYSTNRMEVTVKPPGILPMGTPEGFTALLCHSSFKEYKHHFFFFYSNALTTNMHKLYIHMGKRWKEIQTKTHLIHQVGRIWGEVLFLQFYLFAALFKKYMRWLTRIHIH